MKPIEGVKGFSTEPTTWDESRFKAECHFLGYDCNKVLCSKITPETLKFISDGTGLAIESGSVPAAFTNMETGEITIFPSEISEGAERYVLAHEIFHVAFSKASKALTDELTSRKPGRVMHRFKFMHPFNLNEWLKKCDFVSNYADEFVKLALNGEEVAKTHVITEVLSEMAAVYQETGTLPNTKQWRELYLAVEETAKELGVLQR